MPLYASVPQVKKNFQNGRRQVMIRLKPWSDNLINRNSLIHSKTKNKTRLAKTIATSRPPLPPLIVITTVSTIIKKRNQTSSFVAQWLWTVESRMQFNRLLSHFTFSFLFKNTKENGLYVHDFSFPPFYTEFPPTVSRWAIAIRAMW